eukprot:546900-Prorocentrum_minimum.AAC.2
MAMRVSVPTTTAKLSTHREPPLLSGHLRSGSISSQVQNVRRLTFYRSGSQGQIAKSGRGPTLHKRQFTGTTSVETLAVEIGVAAAAAQLLVIFEGRPRGSPSAKLIEVRVKDSNTHGFGVFAKEDIPQGTVLGSYPGRLRTPDEMVEKAYRSPGAKDYCWLNDKGNYLDPTDADGNVSTLPGPGSFWCFPVDVTLTRVNEPPTGQASINVVRVVARIIRNINVHSKNAHSTSETEDTEGGHGIQYVACRDIMAGEELFIDYGRSYDRSKYNS